MSFEKKQKYGQAGTLISQLNQVSERIFSAILRKYKLEDFSKARGRVLFCLWQNDCVPIKTLSKQTNLDKSTLSGIIKRLIRDGYVNSVQNPKDAREQIICRTAKDKLFKDKLPEVSQEMNEIFYKDFTDQEILEFDKLLLKALNNCLLAE